MNDGIHREVMSPAGAAPAPSAYLPRRKLIVVIGIDDYKALPKLRCAVSDALGVQRQLVESLGFLAPIPPLTNAAASKAAIEALVVDQLHAILQPEDALILFFAGHGTTRVTQLDNTTVETGYIVPAEARAADQYSDLINMEELLRNIGLLPARHILVVLDACHSGMALGAAASQYRSTGQLVRTLLRHRSRRVITSARRDEPALDSGPVPGHSLFTGMLLRALTTGEADVDRNGVLTFSELALFLQQQVGQASGSRQTPDYGSSHLDDRGEMVIVGDDAVMEQLMAQTPAPPIGQDRGPAPPPPRKRGVMVPLAIAGATLALGGGGYGFYRAQSDGGAAMSGSPSGSATAGSCPAGMAFIPAGSFTMGNDAGEPFEGPTHPARVASFCLDMTEVTAGDYEDCVTTSPICVAPTIPPNDTMARAKCTFHNPGMRSHPMNCVDFRAAAAFCADRGKRLPTEVEWEYAARGGEQQRTYPWGNEPPHPQLTNACGPECVEDYRKTHPNSKDPHASGDALPYPGRDKWHSTAPVGSFPAGKSRWGPLDMAGNVLEFTSSNYCLYSDMTQCDANRVILRGGHFLSLYLSDLRGSMRFWREQHDWKIAYGFRCARDVTTTK